MKFIAIVVGLFLSTVAQAWEPTKPIKVIIPSSPGSIHDTGFRSFQEDFESATGAKLVFEYRSGSAGIIATNHFMTLEPDDHTLIATTSISHVMGEVTNPELVTYDFLNDFEYITGVIASSIVIAVSTESEINTREEFFNWLKTTDTPITFSTTFPNQIVATNLILDALGVNKDKAIFVKYSKSVPAATDVASGKVDVWVGGVPPTVPLYQAGKLKYIAVLSKEELDILPGIPTIHEVIPNVIQVSTVGVLTHKGTTPEVLAWYRKHINNALQGEGAVNLRKNRFVILNQDALTEQGLRDAYSGNRKLLEPGYREIFPPKK